MTREKLKKYFYFNPGSVGPMPAFARSMTRQEYYNYRDRELPENENPDDDGYMVINLGAGGDTSWKPKKEFEEQYQAEDSIFGKTSELRSRRNNTSMFLLLISVLLLIKAIID